MSEVCKLTPLPTIKELLKLYKLRALKQLSQNFILNLKLTDKIVRAAGKIKGGEVCEVGPGPGGITRSILAKHPSKMILIEKDVRFKPMLENLAEAANCKSDLLFCDIMNFDMCEVFSPSLKTEWTDQPPNIHIIANLPFNISTPLIIRWMKNISLKNSAWSYGRVKMTLTFQEEVAQRIVAPEKTKERCRMSVMCQNFCKVKHAFTVPSSAFLPKPEVNAGIVHFEPLIEPIIDIDFDTIERVLRIVFNLKGKYLRNTALHLFPQERRKELTEELFFLADLKDVIRPIDLTIEEWRRLIFSYKVIADREPKLYSYDHRGPRKTRETSWKMENSDEENVN